MQSAVPEAVDHGADLREPVQESAELVQHLQLRAGAVVVEQLHQSAHADETVAVLVALRDRVLQRIGELGTQVTQM